MKKIIFWSICLVSIFITTQAWGAVELSYQQNAMFRICADIDDFVQGTIDKASGIDINARAQIDISVMKNYLVVMLAQSTHLDRIYPGEVYDLFLSKFNQDSWHYSTLVVDDDHLPPQNAAVNGTTITCDEHATKTTHLFKWNNSTGLFTDTEEVGSVDAGTVTFSGLSAGYYVLGYTGDEFCTIRLQVT